MTLFPSISPALAVEVAPPTSILVVQEGSVMRATIAVGEGQKVGVVSVQIGSADPVIIPRPNILGEYSKTLTLTDAGSAVVFKATAVSIVNGKSVTSEPLASQPVVFRRAEPPTKIEVTQDDMSLSVAVTFAPDTVLSSLEMKVGGGYYSTVCDTNAGDNCGDGPYVVDLKASQLGKSVVFRVSSSSSRDDIPDSLDVVSDPFVFAQSVQPSRVVLTQDGYIIHIDPTIALEQTIGEVTIYTYTNPDGQTIDPIDGHYNFEISSEDINNPVRVTVTAQTHRQVLSAVKSVSITPGIAALPTLSAVRQYSTGASVEYSAPSGTTVIVSATVDGEDRPVTTAQGVARVALTSDDADRVVQFYAHGIRSTLPDSDEVASEEYVVLAAESPVGIQVSQADASVCAKTQLNPGQTMGVVTAKVDEVSRAVSMAGEKRCITVTRADAGKEVIFSSTARMVGQVESSVLDSDPYMVQVAAKPTVKLSQKGKVISVLIRVSPGQIVGLTTYAVGTSKAIILKPVKGKFSITVKPSLAGKKIVVKTSAAQVGYMSSMVVASAPLLVKK
jgi:hypothetical protein